MTLWHSGVLGLVQGVAEFLPISSSAHLALFPWVLHWEDPGLSFDAALHLGTLFAALWYYRRRWLAAFADAARDPRSAGGRLLFGLALGTVPGGIAGLLFEHRVERWGRFPPVPAACLIVFGLLLGLAARLGARSRRVEDIGWRDALIIGAAQALALVPGVSRSGITITAGLFLGLGYQDAAAYCFLLAAPITAAAALHSLAKLPPGLGGGPFWAGAAVAAVSGALAIKALIAGLNRWGTRPFVIYRVAAGLGILALWAARVG